MSINFIYFQSTKRVAYSRSISIIYLALVIVYQLLIAFQCCFVIVILVLKIPLALITINTHHEASTA